MVQISYRETFAAPAKYIHYGAEVEPRPPGPTLAAFGLKPQVYLLFVGRLVEKKGVSVLLEALSLLDQGAYDVCVVGDGPLRASLTKQAAGLPVSFVGVLGREALPAERGAASIAVFPSVPAASGDQDGLPVALLEAMSSGCAVVASDLPGLRDAIEDGQSGLLTTPGSAKELAEALRRLLLDPDLYAQLPTAPATRAAGSARALGGAHDLLLAEKCRPDRCGLRAHHPLRQQRHGRALQRLAADAVQK